MVKGKGRLHSGCQMSSLADHWGARCPPQQMVLLISVHSFFMWQLSRSLFFAKASCCHSALASLYGQSQPTMSICLMDKFAPSMSGRDPSSDPHPSLISRYEADLHLLPHCFHCFLMYSGWCYWVFVFWTFSRSLWYKWWPPPPTIQAEIYLQTKITMNCRLSL